MKKIVTLWVLGVILQSCGNNDRYLFYVEQEKPREFSEERKVKELTGNALVDILWVIDNSGSMGSFQQEVINNTQLFIQEFVKHSWIQWKMGLISTDEGEAPFLGLQTGDEFTYTDPQPVQRFQNAVGRLGIYGSAIEKSFTPIMDQLNKYPNFLRRNAAFAMILVTDADEQSEDYWGGGVTPQQFIDFITLQKNSLINTRMYGVFGSNDFGCNGEGWFYSGSRYETVFKQMSGVTYPLCSPDFGKNLADLGKDIVKLASYPRLFLGVRPIAKTIRIYYEDQELIPGPPDQGGAWTYDFTTNSIVFYSLDFATDEDAFVRIDYQEDLGYDI